MYRFAGIYLFKQVSLIFFFSKEHSFIEVLNKQIDKIDFSSQYKNKVK